MKKTDTQITLDGNIPKDVIRTRDGGGKTLSYLETWYVIDRINQILGQGNWAYQVGQLNRVFEGEVEQYSGKVFGTSYTATVYLNAVIDGKPVVFSEVGYGDGTDKKNPGKAHELATKEAVSDALKRAAKNLGRSMGLALYDKTQEYVDKQISSNANEPSGTDTTSVKNKRDKSATTSATVSTSSGPISEEKSSKVKAAPTKELITAAFKFLEARKHITADDFKTKYQGGKGISTLTESELTGILTSIRKDFPILQNGASNGKA